MLISQVPSTNSIASVVFERDADDADTCDCTVLRAPFISINASNCFNRGDTWERSRCLIKTRRLSG